MPISSVLSFLLPNSTPKIPDVHYPKSKLNVDAIVEDLRPGYPRFTAILSAHAPFLICRRFTQLRARLLLLKQDRLSILEKQLNEIDRQESRPLFLGQSRHDTNPERARVLSDIESSLHDYDKFVNETEQIMNIHPAQNRDIQSLRNWVHGTNCIAKEEIAYLSHDQEELMALAAADDDAMLQVENWIENSIKQLSNNYFKRQFRRRSNDGNVYIYSGTLIKRLAHAALIFVVSVILLVPIIICNLFSSISSRLVTVIMSTILYLILLSCLVRTQTKDLIFAGATYATVLIVFVSGTTILL